MELQGKSSSFQSIILELIQHKLNMMLAESLQLGEKAVDYKDYEDLTRIILREISEGQIQSAHMTPENAKKTLSILSDLNSDRRSIRAEGDDRKKSPAATPSKNGPYSNLPFS